MPDENRIADYLLHADSNTRRFHIGDAPQALPDVDDPSEEEEATLRVHRAQIHAPGGRAAAPYGRDAEGEPIEVGPQGLVIDAETGALMPLDENGEPIRPGEPRRAPSEESGGEEAPGDQPAPAPPPPAPAPQPSPQPSPQPEPQPSPAPEGRSRPTGAR